jgi:hypothetical protein
MYSRLIYAALAAAATQAACADLNLLPRGTSAAGMGPAQCRAAAAQEFLGQEAQGRTVDEARAHAGALRSRVIRPGDAVTMDADPLRLNLEVDAGGTIRRLRCG